MRSQRGVALIFTLAMVVILSGVILAFLVTMRADRQQTFGYASSIKANEIALGGLQQVAGNLRADIIDNSTVFSVSGARVFQPKERAFAAPERIGFDADDYGADADGEKLPPTLLQVSRAGYDAAASEVFTSATSANGRAIPPARWNAPLLLSGSQGKVPAAFADNPPQWIYFTRAGSRLCTDEEARDGSLSAAVLSNTNAVLGRYAFVIYDEGALLDINVAGFPVSGTSTSPTLSAEARGKSAVAYADLTRLPGLDKADGKTLVENFVNWRNKGGLSVSGSDYAKVVANSATTGFLQFTGSDGAYDNPLLGRRDLLDYLGKVVKNTDAAPYLSTFSRAVTAPSYAPTLNASGSYAYADNANTAGVANRNLANLRLNVSGSATITHYRDDGSTVTHTLKNGEPLLVSRFSLKKIDWLATANPDTGSGPANNLVKPIRDCFGLRWETVGGANGGNPCWNYVGSTGSDFQQKIATLDQVAKEGREPNFFELLKAAILEGSLGLRPPRGAFNDFDSGKYGKFSYTTYDSNDPALGMPYICSGPEGLYCAWFDRARNYKSPAHIPDIQIMQIGANIIDQWDADDYPTAIHFDYGLPVPIKESTDIYGQTDTVYGVENLPLLMRMVELGTTLKGGREQFCGYLQPQLWNPHQEPLTVSGARPQRLAIKAYGMTTVSWRWTLKTASSTGDKTRGGTTELTELDGQYIEFENLAASDPFRVTGKMLTDLPGLNVTVSDEYMKADPNVNEYADNPFAAFLCGITKSSDMPLYDLPGDVDPAAKVLTANSTSTVMPFGCMSFTLGWVDGGGGFHPYSFITGIVGYYYNDLAGSRASGQALAKSENSVVWGRTDPRTIRLGFTWRTNDSADTTVEALTFANNANEIRGTVSKAAPCGGQFTTQPASTAYGYCFPLQYWMVNSSTLTDTFMLKGVNANCYYADNDGVVRPGDALYANFANRHGMAFEAPKKPVNTSVAQENAITNSRAVILNRPFRSVGELGYVFRDQPFKTLDMFSPLSADAALLDVFCLQDNLRVSGGKAVSVSAGLLNPTRAPKPVLEAVLAGVGKGKNVTQSDYYFSGTEAGAVAQKISEHLLTVSGTAPLANRADLVTALGDPIRAGIANAEDKANKLYLETAVRALANVTDTRTWNVMIDVIAQSGRMSPSADKLEQFIVEGEKRYWLHLAIDRYTGQIIDQQLEPVYE